MLLPIIRDKSHDPFIIFGGLFSRDLIFDLLKNKNPDGVEALLKLKTYCDEIKRHCPNEDHLRGKIAEHLITGRKKIPKNSQGDIFYDNVVVEVKHKLNELNLDSIQGSISVQSGRRKETAEEELFRYFKKHKETVSWGVLTSGRIFRIYHSHTDTCYLEFDIFDIVASGSINHAYLFLLLLNSELDRKSLLEKTAEIRSVQAEQKLVVRVRAFYEHSEGHRQNLTKGCLFLLTVKYLEDIGVLPINSIEYKNNLLSQSDNLTPQNLNKIVNDFINGRWFGGVEQSTFNIDDIKSIRETLCNERNNKAIMKLLFDEAGRSINLADIYIDHLGNIYQTHIHNHSEGAYYTPYSIGKKLSEYLVSLNQTSRMKFAQNPDKVIIDPACGSGQLLRALIPFAHNFYDHSGLYKPKNSMRRDFISRLVGIDKDEESSFICKIGLGLMGVEEGLGLAVARLVKCEDTLDAFLDSRRNFSEIPRSSIFAIVTNPPWDSLDFDETQFYRSATGGSLPKRKSLNNSKGAKLIQLQKQVADFELWVKKNKSKLEQEKNRIESLRQKCIKIESENSDFFHGKRNLALHFLYVINRLLEGSGGAYLVVLPDRFFVGEDCPIRDALIDEIEAYVPFQDCGNVFEGVANGTRFGLIFGRKSVQKNELIIDIPIVENNIPVDFISRKIQKNDLRVGTITRNGKLTENRVLPFFKDAEDIDLQTHWLMHRHELTTWSRGRINVGIRGGPGLEYGKLGGPEKYNANIVKSATHKLSDDSKLMGQLRIEFGATIEILPERLKQHYRHKKLIMSNIKTNGIRKVAVGIAQNCLPEKDYNYNESLDVSDLWWAQSLTVNRLVSNLSGSYHINSGTMNFIGKLETDKQIPLGFIEREVFLLKLIGFSLQKSIEYIACILLQDFDRKFILETYEALQESYPEQFEAVSSDRLLVPYQIPLKSKSESVKKTDFNHELAMRRMHAATFIIGNLKGDKYLGRTKLEKCLYILEANSIIDLESNYKRRAAGPLDSEALYNKRFGIEKLASQNKIFEAVEAKTSKKITYKLGSNFDSGFLKSQQLLGVNLGKAKKILNILKPATTEQAEIIATVFAAWNDLIQAGQKIGDDVIINEVRKNWTTTKARFTPDRLKIAIKWLKERGLVPQGVGPRTLK